MGERRYTRAIVREEGQLTTLKQPRRVTLGDLKAELSTMRVEQPSALVVVAPPQFESAREHRGRVRRAFRDGLESVDGGGA